MIEVLIVTGPLGSGKTTAVNRLLKRELAQGRRVAVLINEFGSVGVDGALVDAERPELADIANLVNGCVCCSLRSDVVAALAAWCDRPTGPRPERVVMETTGLADPTELLDLEHEPGLQGRLRLAGCLTIVSCLGPLDHLRNRDLLRRQIALASLVHISKADLDPSLALAWESEIRQAFPHLELAPSRQGETPPGAPDPWLGDVRPLPEGWLKPEGPSFAEARSLSILWDHPIDPAALEALFQGPPRGGELLRAKGICAFDGWPARNDGSDLWTFQMADGRLEVAPLPQPSTGAPAARLAVVIGIGLDANAWQKALRGMERAPLGSRKKVVLGT
ncbi:MAG: GTP-binding protein [Holophagaceae bacterium]|nr:GTP-binding protein [Holophagaceae bacterium]